MEALAPGYRLLDGSQVNDLLANPQWSTQNVIARVGASVNSAPLATKTIIRVVTAAAPGAGIALPQALPGRVLVVVNDAANAIIVFARSDSTIGGFAGATGIPQLAGESALYIAPEVDEWVQLPFPTSVAVNSSTLVVATPHTLIDAEELLLCDVATALTINLPPLVSRADRVTVKDVSWNASVNNISIVPDGTDDIDGVNAARLIEADGGAVTLVPTTSRGWVVI